ncbi:MAG: cation diffusion facilitator family transporter [Candidatus Hadarchaeales archaeon]
MKTAEKITMVSIAVTTFVGVILIFSAGVFGSVAFAAAGMDALTDTLTSFCVLAGLVISRRRADRGHPYGHWQAETFASLILAVILAFMGIKIAFSAVEKISFPSISSPSAEMVFIPLIAIFVFCPLGLLKIKIGKRSNNMAVVADGRHTLSDSIVAAATLFGIAAVGGGYLWADGLVALGISILIFYWGLFTGCTAVNVLMVASPERKIMEALRRKSREIEGVISVHCCRARIIGSKIFADIHVTVDGRLTTQKSHEIATAVEKHLRKEVGGLASVVVHIEPHEKFQKG